MGYIRVFEPQHACYLVKACRYGNSFALLLRPPTLDDFGNMSIGPVDISQVNSLSAIFWSLLYLKPLLNYECIRKKYLFHLYKVPRIVL